LDNLYRIQPTEDRDPRLFITTLENPKEADIRALFTQEISSGNEGLVLYIRESGVIWKVKTLYTLDLKVIGVVSGRGKHLGRLGAVTTKHGRVGTGFDDAQRKEFFDDPAFIGSIIEVSYMEMTKNLKMRHARFIRPRPDKNTEDSV
jgi:ATP-dependent DNA ligase